MSSLSNPVKADPVTAGLWEQAGLCYEQADLPLEAARCYQMGGAYRRAGNLYWRARMTRPAAEMYAAAGDVEMAAWLLVHHDGDAAGARAQLDGHQGGRSGTEPDSPVTALLRRLVDARCAVAEGAPADSVLPALATARQALAGPPPVHDQRVETWSVAVAEELSRFDHVALIYAAAIRGGHGQAARRWSQWVSRRFGAELVLPRLPTDPEVQA